MSSKIEKLLPGDTTAQEYFKYRRLLKGNPRDKILVKSYEVGPCTIQVGLAKLQTSVSKIHNNLRKTNSSKDLLKVAEDLLNHWGIYLF